MGIFFYWDLELCFIIGSLEEGFIVDSNNNKGKVVVMYSDCFLVLIFKVFLISWVKCVGWLGYYEFCEWDRVEINFVNDFLGCFLVLYG